MATNVIPDAATLTADMRYGRYEDLDAITAMLTERAQRKRLAATEITVDVLRGRPAFNASTAGQVLAAKAQAIYREVDGTDSVEAGRTGGGSDAAYAAYAAISGKPVLESLGLPGFGTTRTLASTS